MKDEIDQWLPLKPNHGNRDQCPCPCIPPNNDNSPDSWLWGARSYIRAMDEAGIDVAINLIIQNFRRTDDYPFDQIMASAKTIESAFPSRFFTSAGVDPRIDKNKALDHIDRAINELGCIGIGELTCTMWQILFHDEKRLYPYYEKISNLHVPVCIDATMQDKHSDPELFRKIALDFPDLQICANGTGAGIGDITVHNGATMKAWDRFLEVAEECPNLWLDLDDWQFSNQGMGAPLLVAFLRKAMDSPARKRILFGTDFPIPAMRLNMTELQWIEEIYKTIESSGTVFTQEELDMFFGGNAYDFLKTSKNFGDGI